MKTKFLLLLFFISLLAHGQGLYDYLRKRAETNLLYLAKDQDIKRSVQIDERGIHLLHFGNDKRDISVYWSEIPHVINLLEGASYDELIKHFEHKNTQIFHNASNYQGSIQHYSNFPDSFDNLFVALDPGHFASDLEEAHLEARVVKMKGEDLGLKQDIKFFEAELNYVTALLIKKELEAKGATVFITRPYKSGALGMNFRTWLKSKDGFLYYLEKAVKQKEITHEQASALREAFKDTTNYKNRRDLFDFYKFLDFRSRISKINDFHPNITISIHYNAAENNPFYGDRFLKPVQENYNMMFVPGAFMAGELNRIDKKLDFIRLLLSPDLEKSMRLADLVLEEHERILQVGRANVFTTDKFERATLPTPYPGVLSRNLAITRMVRGTVIYGETLLQDNKEEAIKLSQKSMVLTDPEIGTIKVSPRCKEVADGYVNAIIRFLNENKEKRNYLDSLKASIN